MVQPFSVTLPRQRELVATWVILPILSTTVVALRLFAKRKTRVRYGWSEWWIIASALLTILFFVFCLLMLVYGGIGVCGEDGCYPYLSTSEVTDISIIHDQIGWANNLILVLAVYSCKASILVLYHRVFTGLNRAMSIAIYVAYGITAACFLGSCIGYLAGVKPINKWWLWADATDAEFAAMANVNVAYDALTVFTDFLVFLLPIKSIWGLNMNRQKRIGLVIAFSFGAVTCLISLARVVFTRAYQWKDLYDEGTIWSLAGAEPVAGIVCACLPSLRPLMPKALNLSYGTSGNTAGAKYKSSGTGHANTSVKKSINKDVGPFSPLDDNNSVTHFRHATVRHAPSSEISDEDIELESRKPQHFEAK